MKQFFLALLCLTLFNAPAGAATPQAISIGHPFPELQFAVPPQDGDTKYLGISGKSYFSPSEINAEVVLIEFLNVHCPHCKKQAAIYNQLYERIEQDAQLRHQIKMIGIAVGNLDKEIVKFREDFKVPFPIVADADFLFWRSIGGKTTPFTVYVRQAKAGQNGVVAGTHRGVNHDLNETYARLKEIATEDVADLLLPDEDLEDIAATVVRPFSDKQLDIKVRTALAKHGTVRNFERLDMDRLIYRARVRQGVHQQDLFAEVVSRATVCDICHDVHFIYLFDDELKLVDLVALQLTKYGNEKWSKRDIKQLRQQLKGRQLTQHYSFDPEVDAITSATITSAIIYDALNDGTSLVKELRDKGLLP